MSEEQNLKPARTEFLKIRMCIDCTIALAKIVALNNCEKCHEKFLDNDMVMCNQLGKHYHLFCIKVDA